MAEVPVGFSEYVDFMGYKCTVSFSGTVASKGDTGWTVHGDINISGRCNAVGLYLTSEDSGGKNWVTGGGGSGQGRIDIDNLTRYSGKKVGLQIGVQSDRMGSWSYTDVQWYEIGMD
ncbi:hypothetical protein [Streptomyces sp. NPDC002671]